MPGSVADMSKKLCVGDLILSINTREVLNAAHDSIILALDVCGDDLTLELQRESQHLRPHGRVRAVHAPNNICGHAAYVLTQGGRERGG